MNAQTRTSWIAMPLTVLLLLTTTVIEAGHKARTKLPIFSDIAGTTAGFGILYAAMEAAGREETIYGKRHFTVFAPTDDAFIVLPGLPGMTADQLLADTVLEYRVTRGDRYPGGVLAPGALKMPDRNTTSSSVTGDGAMFEDALSRRSISGPAMAWCI